MTEALITAVNERLELLGGPILAQYDNSVKRAKTFVDFEKWLREQDQDVLTNLAIDFGLLPVVLSVSGIDITYAILSQGDETEIDLTGYIRYIDILLTELTDDSAITTNILGKSLFSDFKLDKQPRMKSLLISAIIEHFINLPELSYDEILDDLDNFID